MSLQEELQRLKTKVSDNLTKDEALDLTIEAAELHMKFLKLVKDKNEKAQLRDNCNLFLDQAEKIKATQKWEPNEDLLLSFDAVTVETPKLAAAAPRNSRTLTKVEEIILLKGSRLHGFKFPPWQAPPDEAEFNQSSDPETYLFSDEADIRLSKEQYAILDDWKRPIHALPPASWRTESASELVPTMHADVKVDFVQDAATDCSIVASLAAVTARAQLGHPKLLSSIIYPYDTKNSCPAMSPNGKYIVRLFFNGCARKVIIDDRLPVSKTNRILYVVDRRNPALLWPALMEKAYLKARGGYDFPGSNSGTDLFILTGWIPEQMILQYSETDPKHLWEKIAKAFQKGDVVMTLGTGKMTEKAEQQSGLAGMHDYAILNIREDDGSRQFLVKNPWLQGSTWKDHRSIDLLTDDPTNDDDHNGDTPHYRLDPTNGSQGQGTFWMDVGDILQYFDSIYLNWNPALFKLKQDIHFTWDLTAGSDTGRSASGSFTNNPQFAVTSSEKGLIWILLSKHFTDEKTLSHDSPDDSGYISLYAFSNHGQRVNLSKGYLKQGPYVDSPQTLLQLDVDAECSYTIVISEEFLPAICHAFTLTAFSNTPFSLDKAPARFQTKTTHKASWTKESAGGNAESSTYAQNPQFSLHLPTKSPISLLIETLVPTFRVHCKLLHGYGERVFSVRSKDVIVDSGNYSKGCAQAQTEELDAGTYTIVCSTFEAGQLGEFSLVVESMANHTVNAIRREGAGKLRTKLADASFGSSVRVLAAPMKPLRLARVSFQAKYIELSSSALEASAHASLDVHCPLRLTIELGRGPDRHILMSSFGGAFSDSASGVRTEEFDIDPNMIKKSGIMIVLERLTGCEAVNRAEERVSVEMWADTIDCTQIGVWREYGG